VDSVEVAESSVDEFKADHRQSWSRTKFRACSVFDMSNGVRCNDIAFEVRTIWKLLNVGR
jgi:hypothetical protein